MKLDKLEEISAAKIGYFIMGIILNDDIQDKIDEITTPFLGKEVAATRDENLASVNAADDPATLVDLMRKTKNLQAKRILIRKILDNQEETMPLIMKRFLTSSQDVFVETAVLIFGHCEEKHVDAMLAQYDQIRSIYAQSEFCMMLGFRERKDCVPFLEKEYARMKAMDTEESFAQGPLLALHVLNGEIFFKHKATPYKVR